MKKVSKGFTLIEVLIAAVILFSALAVTSELYSSSSLSAEKASESSRVSQASLIAVQTIKTQLRKSAEQRSLSEHTGVSLVMGIEFHWTANRESFLSRARELSDIDPPKQQFSLFDVEVTPVSARRQFASFSFKVVTW